MIYDPFRNFSSTICSPFEHYEFSLYLFVFLLLSESIIFQFDFLMCFLKFTSQSICALNLRNNLKPLLYSPPTIFESIREPFITFSDPLSPHLHTPLQPLSHIFIILSFFLLIFNHWYFFLNSFILLIFH